MSAPPRSILDERASRGYWTIVWRKLRANPNGMAGLVLVALIFAVAVLAPLIANDRPIVCRYKGETSFPALASYVDAWVPWQSLRYELKSLKVADDPPWFPFSGHYERLDGRTWKEVAGSPEMGFAIWPPIRWNPSQFDSGAIKKRPSDATQHLLGTDDQGRDVLARLVHGCVVAVTVGMIAIGIATFIGVSLGLLAGYLGGRVDLVLSRLVEIVITFPTFFLIIAVIAFLEPSIVNIMMVIGFVGWTGIFRILRGEVLKTKAEVYVTAAEALGASRRRIMLLHVLPNAMPPIFVTIAFGIASAVLTESSLSFLGFGDPSVPSWGEIVSQGRNYVSQGLWHLTVYPGIAIFLTLTAFNLLGQGLRDAMDPKLRR